MITERDLLRLPYTRDLTEAGLVYARRVVVNRHGPVTSRTYDGIRRAAASAALNLSVRRYLVEEGVPFAVQDPTPFSDPDRYDLRLGDRACELKAYLISRASQWQALTDDPRLALSAHALVPLDRDRTETVRTRDIYVFSFVGAGVGKRESAGAVHAVSHREYWMHVMPAPWQGAQLQAPLGPLTFKVEATPGLSIELGGKDRSGAQVEIRVQLDGGNRLALPNSLLTLSHVCAPGRPTGRLGIHAPARRLTHVVEPTDWRDVWLEGWGIVLLGWLTRQEFRARAKLIPQGQRVFQFDRTKTRNLAVGVAELKPIADLFSNRGLSQTRA